MQTAKKSVSSPYSHVRSGLLCRSRPLLQRTGRVSPLELFMRVQSGLTVQSTATMKNFMLQHFSEELDNYGMSPARMNKMDNRSIQELLKRLFFEKYMSIEFAVFTFDLEFTGLPKFTKTGPTEDIIEIGLYCPDTEETFSKLVKPFHGHTIQDEVTKLTGISKEHLETADSFAQVWKEVKTFIADNAEKTKQRFNYDQLYESKSDFGMDNILLLSHGGKLADVSMLKWACRAIDEPIDGSNNVCPPFTFGDTNHHIRDLHRRRPVTKDKLPPSWSLEDLATWLGLDVPSGVHRAGIDAKLTWDVLSHNMDRYGDVDLLPRQQLVSRFFDDLGKQTVADMDEHHETNVSEIKRGAPVSRQIDILDEEAEALITAEMDAHNL